MSNKIVNYPVTPQPKLALDAQPMDKSLSVTIASDQTPIPVSGSFSDPSVGTNGTTAPTSSGLSGAVDATTGYLEPASSHKNMGKNYLYVDGSEFTQPISAMALPLPANAATETTANNTLNAVNDVKAKLNTNAYQNKLLVDIGNDVFNVPTVGTKVNQIEIDFNTAPGAALITNTTASSGTITQVNGQSVYYAAINTTSQAKSVSVQNLIYRPGNESYAMFTASFTNAVTTGTYQRIGLYDATNGFYVGFEGRDFGITKRTGGVDTFVQQSSFNGDKLDGVTGSKFTRDGYAEAINYGYSNLFRIRFGWLGSASILFEIMSPDGTWVTFHTIKQPNSAQAPSLTIPNLPMTIDVNKNGNASGVALTMTTTCWSAGTTSAFSKVTETLTDNSLATLSRSVITGVTTGGGGGYVNVKVNPSGALVADVTGTVAATQSGTWNINNVSGTVSLPTGAATSANQTTANSSLSSIDGKLTSVTVGTLPSIPAGSNNIGSITNVTGTVSLPTGAATSSNQTTANSSLASIDGKITACNTGSVTVVSSKSPINVTGSGSGAGATVSTVITLTAPANAVGFILMNIDTSSANIRYAIGRTASATLGQQLQPGRDTGFIPCGANISLCAESGTQNYDVQWVSQ